MIYVHATRKMEKTQTPENMYEGILNGTVNIDTIS
jgi:hypothetical protein